MLNWLAFRCLLSTFFYIFDRFASRWLLNIRSIFCNIILHPWSNVGIFDFRWLVEWFLEDKRLVNFLVFLYIGCFFNSLIFCSIRLNLGWLLISIRSIFCNVILQPFSYVRVFNFGRLIERFLIHKWFVNVRFRFFWWLSPSRLLWWLGRFSFFFRL